MSGDLMHKGLMELSEAKADSVTLEDYIPIYQKRTLQVMRIKVADLMDAMARLSETMWVEAMNGSGEVATEEAATEEEATEETPSEEIKKPTKTRGKSKNKKETA